MITKQERWVLRSANGWTAVFERNPLDDGKIVYQLNYRGSKETQQVLSLEKARELWRIQRKLGFVWVNRPTDDF